MQFCVRRDETALFAGLYGLAEPDGDTEIEGFLQVLRLENAGGEDGSTVSYLIGGAVTLDRWQILTARSARFRDHPDQGGSLRTDSRLAGQRRLHLRGRLLYLWRLPLRRRHGWRKPHPWRLHRLRTGF